MSLRITHAAVALVATLLAAAPLAVAGAEATAVVGHVSLLIGEAKVFHRDGSQLVLRQGAEILVGDRVETSANGHVHLRFVDQGAVSVRPDSVLEVQSYQFDPLRPSTNEVRLRVEQGTARSISGGAAEADKSRFRMNTPIAAIGVRGTDFIVQSSSFGVRAVVAQGAISITPIGAGCSASTLGPCTGADSKILSADMGRVMAEVRSGDSLVRLAPAVAALLPTAAVAVASTADSAARDKSPAGESAARAMALAAASPSLDAAVRNNDRAAADLLAIAPVARFDSHDVGNALDTKAQLVWGRWSFSSQALDNVSVPYAVASTGRQVTVGDLDAGLFRSGTQTSLSDSASPQSGRFDLRLTHAQAGFEIGGRTESASVDGGTLSLDLGLRTFATALALSSASGGNAQLRVAGTIQDNGIFTARDSEQRIAGAVSFDGKESGYLFERIAGGGVFRGKTLWGKGPP
jgi:hypothetical protein